VGRRRERVGAEARRRGGRSEERGERPLVVCSVGRGDGAATRLCSLPCGPTVSDLGLLPAHSYTRTHAYSLGRANTQSAQLSSLPQIARVVRTHPGLARGWTRGDAPDAEGTHSCGVVCWLEQVSGENWRGREREEGIDLSDGGYELLDAICVGAGGGTRVELRATTCQPRHPSPNPRSTSWQPRAKDKQPRPTGPPYPSPLLPTHVVFH
jgi:hypothetical protein